MPRLFLFSLVIIMAPMSVANAAGLSAQQITEILSHPDRPGEDSKRDPARQPLNIMAFSEIATGDKVLDLFAGGGWYSELFSKAVGESGKVYAQNDEVIWRFAGEAMQQRSKDNRLPNVRRFDAIAIADIVVPDASLDLVFTALNYHDLFFTHRLREGKRKQVREKAVDYKLALARVKRAMKDDGLFVIIDHAAVAGSGYEAANALHRIDPNIVKFQMNEAGFNLVEEAYYLRNPQDDLSKTVFDSSIRGRTERFVYKFAKK
jgi:predicted methyltransferase